MTVLEKSLFSPLTDEQDKYLLIILESVPTMLERTSLEEIFTEIGRIKNLSNFLVPLTCKEATDRLMVYNNFQKVSCPWNCDLAILNHLFFKYVFKTNLYIYFLLYFCEQSVVCERSL